MEKTNVKALPRIGYVEATKKGFKNLFNFEGRARRSEYWWFFLNAVLIQIVVFLLIGCFLYYMIDNNHMERLSEYLFVSFILSIISSFPLILMTSIQTRRLHDNGVGTWIPVLSMIDFFLFCLLLFFVIIGHTGVGDGDLSNSWIISNISRENRMLLSKLLKGTLCFFVILQFITLIYTLLDNSKGENKYGKSPKYIEV